MELNVNCILSVYCISIFQISYRNHPLAKTVQNTSRDGTPLTASSKLFSSFSRNCFISQWPALGDNKNTTHQQIYAFLFLSSLSSLALSFKQMFSLLSLLMSTKRAPQDLLHLITTRNIPGLRTEGFVCLPLFITFTSKNEIAKG